MPRLKPPTPAPAGDRNVNLRLTEEHHARLRIVAAEHGMGMADFARSLVVREIERTRKEGTS